MNNNSKTNIYFSLNLRGYWSSPVQYGHVTMFMCITIQSHENSDCYTDRAEPSRNDLNSKMNDSEV